MVRREEPTFETEAKVNEYYEEKIDRQQGKASTGMVAGLVGGLAIFTTSVILSLAEREKFEHTTTIPYQDNTSIVQYVRAEENIAQLVGLRRTMAQQLHRVSEGNYSSEIRAELSKIFAPEQTTVDGLCRAVEIAAQEVAQARENPLVQKWKDYEPTKFNQDDYYSNAFLGGGIALLSLFCGLLGMLPCSWSLKRNQALEELRKRKGERLTPRMGVQRLPLPK